MACCLQLFSKVTPGCHGDAEQPAASCRVLRVASDCTVTTREPVLSLHAVMLLL